MGVFVLARRALPWTWLSGVLCGVISPVQAGGPSASRQLDARAGTSPAIWLLHPKPSGPMTVDSPWDIQQALFQGIRVRQRTSGATERSNDFMSGSATGALRVPDAWGGGFLFHSDVEAETSLWYAPTWLSPLVPLVRFAERAARVALGFGKIFVHLGDSGETVALDVPTGRQTSLSPLPESPGYFDLSFWNDWFGAANTDVRGVLVTFDAGATWHSTGITDATATFSAEDEGIGIRTSGAYLVLQPTGAWLEENETLQGSHSSLMVDALLASAEENKTQALPRALGADAARQAVLHGWPQSSHSAVVATRGSVGVVNLLTGEQERVRRAQYDGYETCHANALGDGVALICPLVRDGVGVFRLKKDLSLEPLGQWAGPVMVSSNAATLLVHAPCPTASSTDAKRQHAVCVLDGRGLHEVALPKSVYHSSRLIPLGADKLAWLTPPTSKAKGSLARITSSSGQPTLHSTPLHFSPKVDDKTRNLIENGFWLSAVGTLSGKRLGFWVGHGNRLIGVAIDEDGIITVGRRIDADLRRTHVSGPRALELTSGEVAYQSTDFGQSWTELPVPRGLTAAATRNTHEEVGCSEVGCAFGAWLRVGYDTTHASEQERSEPASTGVNSAVARLSRVPFEASTPAPLAPRSPAYSHWRMTCYPTGAFEDAARGSAVTTYATGQGATRVGSQTGFPTPVTASAGNELDLAPSARRTFLGVKHPEVERGTLAFDKGDDGEYQFRAYTLGLANQPWSTQASWMVRVADRFSVSGLWSTAPTRAPWPDILSAAQLFGADRAHRHSSSWQLSLDPSERGGALRVTSSGTTELHFVEANLPTLSIGGQSVGTLAGTVKVNGTWYYGSHDNNRFALYQVRHGAPVMVQSYPVSDFVHVTLIRNESATRLALLVRAPAGTWHIYSLSDAFEATEPLVLERETLNEQWPKCTQENDGWVIVSALPLSRFTPSESGEVLTFESDTDDLKAEAVVARTVVNSSAHCVQALAARLASAHAPKPESKRLPPIPNTIPLTLSDRSNDVRHGFQCGN